jgi:hypothetical protein
MKPNETNDDWAIGIERYWRAQGTGLQQGVPEAYIHQTGNDLGIVVPPAFVALYKQMNGFKKNVWTPGMFIIWSLERMLEEHIIEKDRNFVGFSDFLICSHVIGFRKDKEGIWKDCDPHLMICASFEEAIELIKQDSLLVH